MKNLAFLKDTANEYSCLLAFPLDAQTYLLSSLDRLCANEESFGAFSDMLEEYDGSLACDIRANVIQMKSVSEKAGVHPLTGSMLLYLCMLPRLRRYFEEKGIPDALFLATVPDLLYKLTECKLVDGVYGISDGAAEGWYPNVFRCRTLTFERLQFVFDRADFECETDGVKIEKDTPVLHIHIPRTGTKIDRESIAASYRAAADYFAPAFGENPIIMTTRTWMFFPRHEEFLSPDSNMMQFYHDFQLVESGEYPDYSQVWRLFDCYYTGNPDDLPQNTSLRRAYADLIRRGEKTGWGRGVMIYKK